MNSKLNIIFAKWTCVPPFLINLQNNCHQLPIKVFIASLFVFGVKINVVLLLKYTTNTYWSSNGYIPTYSTRLGGEKMKCLILLNRDPQIFWINSPQN
jgi:hypothetical protein